MSVQSFFESEGGKTAAMIGLLVWLAIIAMIMHMTGHDPQETGRTLISNTFTALFVALLAKLTGKSAGGPGGS